MKKSLLVLAVALALTGCDVPSPTSDEVQNRRQENLNAQAISEVGMPSILNFQEKRNLKMILELRDSAKLSTITYTQDMSGKLHRLCDSVGYGIPYATQYTNPSRMANVREAPMAGNVVLPQADPNGLYSPASAEGTWVLCANPETKGVSPIYVEPKIIVSPFALQ